MDVPANLPASAHPGTLHYIPPNLSAFEPTKPLVRSANVNTLLWVGGMFDTPGSVSYPFSIAQSLGPTWTVMTALLGSSGLSWGVSSIARDAEDMAKIVAYIKELRPGGMIIIMGHSTGCQDCMEYIVGKNAEKRPAVDGIILQAPVSDREAIMNDLPEAFMHEANQLALQMCRDGKDKDAMPNRLTKQVFGRIAITARRWVDISSPGPYHEGADDYFSSDLPDKRLRGTFGKLPASTPLLILYGGADASVPEHVDKRRLVQKWMHITEGGGGSVDGLNGGVVVGATHNLNAQAETIVQDLVRRVAGFIARMEKGEIGAAAGEVIRVDSSFADYEKATTASSSSSLTTDEAEDQDFIPNAGIDPEPFLNLKKHVSWNPEPIDPADFLQLLWGQFEHKQRVQAGGVEDKGDWGTTLDSIEEGGEQRAPDEIYWEYDEQCGMQEGIFADDVDASFGSESTLIEW
ncbi:uncharacterized protein LTR77_002326 [Saxophila tyrrhenica]|uniref:DUF1749-domain-containing protein n=1 Tax=Saxophila tyrrhenica TaxID=1690608 RepID=A0AAV9PIV6_9PEZI|nr:hypothetical protein LTR77_002326 [Saxophila tyrrhenica]